MTSHHHLPGYLIAIEGIDGAGKTTQAHHLQSKLKAKNLRVVRTKEPTTGTWGQMLRDSALTGRLSLDEEVEAFIKDRQEHVETRIYPELRAGAIVIVDRYYFSSMAYQGSRGADPEMIRIRNEEFAPEPDLLVILDLDPLSGLQRIKTRGDRANHFEQTHTLEFARKIFLEIKKPYKHVINAVNPAESITAELFDLFAETVAIREARQSTDAKEKLNAVLKVYGADPV